MEHSAAPAPITRHVKVTGNDTKSNKHRVSRRSRARKVTEHTNQSKDTTPRYVSLLTESQRQELRRVARELVRPGLGILAGDDSIRQIDGYLKELKLSLSDQNRRKYHEVFLDGDHEIEAYLSGVLLREETVDQILYRGKKIAKMIKNHRLKLGIRMDRGVVPLAGTDGEYTTSGLDKLEDLCKKVKSKGAEFALWRTVYKLSEFAPSRLAIQENSNTLARFAVVCQSTGLVPIVSVEVLREGSCGNTDAQEALREVLAGLVKALLDHHVCVEGTLIRITPAAPGPCFKGSQDIDNIACATVRILNECVPPAFGGVLLAREHNLPRSLALLNAMQLCRIQKPFFYTFCYSQVIQSHVIPVWAGHDRNLFKARVELMKKLKSCSLASLGQYSGGTGSIFANIERVEKTTIADSPTETTS